MSRFKFEMGINNTEKSEEPEKQETRIPINIKITDDGPLVVERLKHYQAAIQGTFGLYGAICAKTEKSDLNLGEMYRILSVVCGVLVIHKIYPFDELKGEEIVELILCFVTGLDKNFDAKEDENAV
jgi:hypothetical protein